MAGVCAHGGLNRCWSCMIGDCYDSPTYHVWYDDKDIEALKREGREVPTGRASECGCFNCGWPALEDLKEVSKSAQDVLREVSKLNEH